MHVTSKHSWLKHIDFMLIDFASLTVSFALAYCWHFGDLGFLASTEWQRLLAILLLLELVLTFLTNPYSGIFRRPYYEDALKMFLLAVYSFVCACVFFYVFKLGDNYSRLTLAGMYAIHYALSFSLKSLRKKMLLSGRAKSAKGDVRNLFVVAYAGSVEETIEYINSSDYREYQIVGFSIIEKSGLSKLEMTDTYADLPIIPLLQLGEYVTHNNVDDVFVGVDPTLLSRELYELLVANEIVAHLSIEGIIGIQTDVQSVERIGVYKTLNVGKYTFDSRQALYLAVKRVFDVVLGCIGCALLLPVMLVVKLIYLASGDTAPIVYRQTRIGLRGNPFRIYKLRSMVANADEVLQELLKDPARRAEWEENQKFADDPRITPIGRFIRKASIDEFPQFLNVVKGDMSIVGPRPLVPGELEEHGGLSLYNKVKPGITGWWGCNGRSNINYRERLELEYHYVKHCSLYLDVLCILRTGFAVLKRDGAK